MHPYVIYLEKIQKGILWVCPSNVCSAKELTDTYIAGITRLSIIFFLSGLQIFHYPIFVGCHIRVYSRPIFQTASFSKRYNTIQVIAIVNWCKKRSSRISIAWISLEFSTSTDLCLGYIDFQPKVSFTAFLMVVMWNLNFITYFALFCWKRRDLWSIFRSFVLFCGNKNFWSGLSSLTAPW